MFAIHVVSQNVVSQRSPGRVMWSFAVNNPMKRPDAASRIIRFRGRDLIVDLVRRVLGIDRVV
jgi:hypothetical protein